MPAIEARVFIGRRRTLGVVVGALRAGLGHCLQQRLRLVGLARLEQRQRLRIAGVGRGAFGDGRNRFRQVSFDGRNCRLRGRSDIVFIDQRRDLIERLLLPLRLPKQPAANDGQ